MLVSEVMNKNVVVIKKDATLKDAAGAMAKMGIGSLVVVESEKVVGLLTNNDIVKSIAMDKPSESILVEEFMSKNLISIESDKTIEDAVDLMIANKMREIPVIDEGKIKGLLSVTDIAVIEPKLIANIAGLLQMQFPGFRGG